MVLHRVKYKRNEYPKGHWSALRKNRIRPDSVSLRRHARNLIDTARGKAEELHRYVCQRQYVLEELSESEKTRFQNFIDSIVQKQVSKKKREMESSRQNAKPISSFPDSSEK